MTTDVGNGMAFQLSTSELGISPYSLLEAAWCLPAVIYGIRERCWTYAFNKHVMPHPVVVLWLEMKLLEATPSDDSDKVTVKLTPGGENLVRMGELLEYEFSMMIQQLEGDKTTYPEKYQSLRSALAFYTDTYLDPLVKWVIDRSEHQRVLDFGGGDGLWLDKLLEAGGETATGVLYDKAPGMPNNRRATIVIGDFLTKDNQLRDWEHHFDTIILSEVLHCLGPDQYDIILPKLARLLTATGKLFIIEQGVSFRMNWRLYDMTKGGFALAPPQVVDIIQSRPHLGLELCGDAAVATHYAICFQPTGVQNDTIN